MEDDSIVRNIAHVEDLVVSNAGNYVSANDSFDIAIGKLDTAIHNIPVTDFTVTVTESTPEGYAKAYTLYQKGQLITTINIPKDMVVSSGSVVDKTEEGPWGPAGKYIELVLANAANDKIWIPVGDLIETHTHSSLVSNNATLSLAPDGVTTITLKGSGSAPVKGILTISGGTVSGNNPMTGEQASFDVPDGTIEIPLSGGTNQFTPFSGNVVVDGITYSVARSPTSQYKVTSDSISITDMSVLVGVTFSIDNTDYDNPTLGPSPMSSGTFTGSATYSQITGEAQDVVKTLATTDGIQNAINALDAEVTSTGSENVKLKVTETNGKITEVKILKDGADIADGSITTTKIAALHYIKLIDDTDGQEYILRVHNGHLEVLGESGPAYTPTGYPVYIGMDQISGESHAIHYLWKAYIDDEDGYLCYATAIASPTAQNPGGYPNDDINMLIPLDNAHEYEELPWHINWMGNFTGQPVLVCEQGCPFTPEMFDTHWVDPAEIDPNMFPDESAGHLAPRRRIAKRK